MRIGIVSSYAANRPAGLERFLIDLLQATDVSSENTYVVYTKKGTGLLSILKENDIVNVDVIEVGFGKFWKDLGLFFSPRADAYIFHGPIVPFFFSPKNYFVILHDFAYRYFPAKTSKGKMMAMIMNFLTRKAIKRASKIITVSNATKSDLIKLFGDKSEHIVAIHNGFKKVCSVDEEPVAGIREPYFLYLGTLKKRKNAVSVVKAFSQYKKKRADDYTLVIVGKKTLENPYVKEVLDLAKEEGVQDSVIFTGHISDAQISFIYRHARALVWPSLLEGFGFPILEAMSCGVPVITSNTGALAEVAQNAATLVDPLNIGEIVEAMEQIVDDENLRQKRIADGLLHVQKFSWKKSAEQLQRLVMDNSKIT